MLWILCGYSDHLHKSGQQAALHSPLVCRALHQLHSNHHDMMIAQGWQSLVQP